VNGLQDQGFDESNIRMVISTAYIAAAETVKKHRCWSFLSTHSNLDGIEE